MIALLPLRKAGIAHAQSVVAAEHYLKRPVDPRCSVGLLSRASGISSASMEGEQGRLDPLVALRQPLSAQLPVTTLGVPVCVVVPYGSEKEVARIDARPVVAPVANEQPVRDRAVSQLPGGAMSRNGLAASIALGIEPVLAVAISVYRSAPLPATVRTTRIVNAGPEGSSAIRPLGTPPADVTIDRFPGHRNPGPILLGAEGAPANEHVDRMRADTDQLRGFVNVHMPPIIHENLSNRHRGVIYRAAGFELFRTNARGIQTWRLSLAPLTADEDAQVRRAAETSPRSIEFRERRRAASLQQLAFQET